MDLLKDYKVLYITPNVGLVLLDLSATFNTIDHSILVNCLQHWYDIGGVVLKWVQSYLNSRKQGSK